MAEPCVRVFRPCIGFASRRLVAGEQPSELQLHPAANQVGATTSGIVSHVLTLLAAKPMRFSLALRCRAFFSSARGLILFVDDPELQTAAALARLSHQVHLRGMVRWSSARFPLMLAPL